MDEKVRGFGGVIFNNSLYLYTRYGYLYFHLSDSHHFSVVQRICEAGEARDHQDSGVPPILLRPHIQSIRLFGLGNSDYSREKKRL